MKIYYLQHKQRKTTLLIIDLTNRKIRAVYLSTGTHTKQRKRRKKALERIFIISNEYRL